VVTSHAGTVIPPGAADPVPVQPSTLVGLFVPGPRLRAPGGLAENTTADARIKLKRLYPSFDR
jgi:hypothetical protein